MPISRTSSVPPPLPPAHSSEPAVVKGAIALLKRHNPRTRVLVSVGGATYTAWDRLNATAIASFVRQFGLDGVDVDYEGDGSERAMGASQSGCEPSALCLRS